MEPNRDDRGLLSTWAGCNGDCKCGLVTLQSCNGQDLAPESSPTCEVQTLGDTALECQCHPEKIKDLYNQIDKLNKTNHHLEVHCFMYQQALINVKGGVRTWNDKAEEKFASDSKICHHCGTERLMAIIAHLQQKVADLKASQH